MRAIYHAAFSNCKGTDQTHRQVNASLKHGEKGPIKLQDHGNPMHYRNLWIRELKPVDSQ